MRYLLCWLSLCLFVEAQEVVAPKAQRVEMKTSDGVLVVGSYFKPVKATKDAKAPCAILVHMYRQNRDTWAPLVPSLLEAGFAVMAYDIRGAGESILPADKNLVDLYQKRDATHFAEAWRDAEAAHRYLADLPEVDGKRVVLVGASVGCSISLEYTARTPDVKGVICLSPGLKYMGIDSARHVAQIGSRRVLLMAPDGEKAAPQELKKSSETVLIDIRPGDAKFHGTRMFGAPYAREVMEAITTFLKDSVAPLKTAKPS